MKNQRAEKKEFRQGESHMNVSAKFEVNPMDDSYCKQKHTETKSVMGMVMILGGLDYKQQINNLQQ